MTYRIFILLLVAGLLPGAMSGQSCQVNGRPQYTFEDVRVILDRNKCNSCHAKGSYQNSWHYTTYESLTSRNACNSLNVVPGRSDLSPLIDKLNGGPTSCGAAMPPGNQRISNADLLAIEKWVDSGAPEFCIPDYDKVRNIFLANQCQSCHNSQSVWTFGEYDRIFMKPANSLCQEPVIEKFNAAGSLLYAKLSSSASCGNKMLGSTGQPLTDMEVDAIRDWINAGASVAAKPLPVSLKDFSTRADGNKRIRIFWVTEAEQNLDRFELEVSTDGIKFEFLGHVKPKGGPSFGSVYEYDTDEVQIGFNYFRLKIYDLDGTYTYSPVRVERISNDEEIFRVYPGLVTAGSDFVVEWYPIDGREKVRLFVMDITGKNCAEFILNNGINHLVVNNFKTGVYYLTVQDYSFHTLVKKIVVTDF